ncbi:MAG: type VI secretion system baseplate subunit TssE [Gemmatimonadales bacterium]|nr:MAG: type VI secretion system baseplate subunit TssE [Gemmatimonadales bacterium]
MSRSSGAGAIPRLSVLDRLAGGAGPREGGGDPEATLARYRQSVTRDLEWLLNTRRLPDPGPLDDFPELRTSVLSYGPPDISSLSGDSSTTRRQLQRQMEQLIRTFEPRLTQVRVRLEEEGAGGGRRIRFGIQASLRLGSEAERMEFDTLLELASGRFIVKGGDHA